LFRPVPPDSRRQACATRAGGFIRTLVLGIFWLAAAQPWIGCGYQLAGQGELPGNVQSIAVRMLENKSSETGVESLITNALINELNRRRRGAVTAPDRADAVLAGTVESLRWDTVAHRGVNTAAERRVYATISLTLTDRSGKVLWRRSGLSGSQAYAVVGDNKTATEINRRQAVAVLAEQVAENVYRRLTDNF
jgi:outer membrane lipopolysaccharide assembly protein LptE/RlpB